MEANNKFYRCFLIFSQEDSGYGVGGSPSGYVKIEARDGKGKIQVSVQNLKEENNGCYKVYILKCDEKYASPAYIGIVPLYKNKGELRLDFDPRNVADTGIVIEEFNIAVVIADYKNKASTYITCPLAAYKDKKVQWKNKFKEALASAGNSIEEDEGDAIKKHELFSKYNVEFESKYTNGGFSPGIPFGDIEKIDTKGNEDTIENTGKVITKEEDEENQYGEDLFDKGTSDLQKESFIKEIGENIEKINLAENTSEETEAVGKDTQLKFPGFSSIKTDEFDMGNSLPKTPFYSPAPCSYMNSSYCSQQANGNATEACMNCSIRNMRKEEAPQNKILNDKATVSNMEKFHKNLDIYFEISDPFRSSRRDYKWWKANNPVQLNNIFYQCNIKTPLLFNPSVMMAHYKYRYLIVGIYTDRIRKKEYIVCGIPGVYGIDDKPFGGVCRWVQVEGNRPRYGAFGYWIVYIDPMTGKFLELN